MTLKQNKPKIKPKKRYTNQSSTQEQKRKSSLPRNRPQEPSNAIIANMNTVAGNSTYLRMCQLVALWVKYGKKRAAECSLGKQGTIQHAD